MIEKKFFGIILSFIICLMAYAEGVEKELYWYLGASMSKPGKEIVQKFNHDNKSFKVLLITGGSGQLLSKIIASEKGDIYTPASTFFLEKAIKSGVAKSYRKFIEQVPVFGLASQLENKKLTFYDLISGKYKLAVGNPKTMALGQTFLEIKKKMGKKFAKQIKKNEFLYAVNITQIVNYILTGTVDAGLIFDSVAKANKIDYIEIPEKFNIPEYAYLAVLNSCSNVKYAEIFEEYIYQHKDVFEKYGFMLIK